ncbi:uncharacterized protein LOC110182336 [Drosophila serrata]|uniref:uncharacterized protein LOC110182336 n=1 Tax=Drosophila serrata TaxID=7274 RepID=UPI000A1D012C|nr:uncharacterized protein LOC110182336 [Drosophila serrata]KAH8374318.1 hypothetical protein KR200_012084 [Drosophila serrata]
MQKVKPDPDSSDKKVKRLYHQRYRPEWEKFPAFANWLGSANDGYSAHCRICDVSVLARLASIKQHLITRKHQDGARCNDFLSQNMIKGDSDAVKQMCRPSAAKIKGDPDAQQHIGRSRAGSKPKAKPKPKANVKVKRELKVVKREPRIERVEVVEHDIASNDSILDDLLGNEPMVNVPEEYVVEAEAELMDENVLEVENVEDAYEELMPELNDDNMSEDVIISEFDLFGKSLALQLNNMDLEDALLCQERLQVVLTEFRLKILKRKREATRSS